VQVILAPRHVALVAAGVVATAQAPSTCTTPIATKSGYKVSSWRINDIDLHNRSLLVRALMTGAPDGMVMFATEMGAMDRAMRGVAALGGDIVAHFDKQFAKAKSVPGVLMALIDGATNSLGSVQSLVNYSEPKKSKADSLKADSVRKDSLSKDSIRVAALPLIPDAACGAETPFVSMSDMRAHDLRRMDPRFDGRGATVVSLITRGADV